MSKFRTISPHDAGGRIFRNDGPRNPVIDLPSARAMALAEQRVIDQHNEALRLVGSRQSYDDLTDTAKRRSLTEPLSEQRDGATERVRANVAGQFLERAQLLYHLVELTPPLSEISILAPSPPSL